jgi:hypothetical protein
MVGGSVFRGMNDEQSQPIDPQDLVMWLVGSHECR